MVNDRFARLTARQRDCLRLVRRLKGSKEIATALGIAKGTVDGYLNEAVRMIGARDRRDAALQFEEYESGRTPSEIGGQSARVVDLPSLSEAGPGETTPPAWRRWVPFRSEGLNNELGFLARIAWVIVIAIAFAIGFGMLAVGLRVVSDVVAGSFGR